MKRLFAALCAAALCLSLAACTSDPSSRISSSGSGNDGSSSQVSQSSSQSSEEPKAERPGAEEIVGGWDDQTYKNEWAGVTFTLPDTWMALTTDQISQVLGAGAEVIADGLGASSDSLSAKVGDTDIYAYYAISADGGAFFFLDLFDKEAGKVPSMTPKEYAQQVIALMKSMDNISVTTTDIVDDTFCGLSGVSYDVEMTVQGVTQSEHFFIGEKDNYFLGFCSGSTTEDGAASLKALLESCAQL